MIHETLPNVRPGDAVRAEHITQLTQAIRRRTPVSSKTVRVHDTGAGYYLDAGAGQSPGDAAVCEKSWTPTHAGNDGAGNNWVTINPGRLTSGTAATITLDDAEGGGSTNILATPAPKLAIPDSGLYIVYLEVTVSLNTTVNNWVTSCSISSATIEVSDGLPASTATVRRVELFRWYNGALYSQLSRYNMILSCRDDGTSTGVGFFEFIPGA